VAFSVVSVSSGFRAVQLSGYEVIKLTLNDFSEMSFSFAFAIA